MDELELFREYAVVFGRGVKYHYYIFSKGGFTEVLMQAADNGERMKIARYVVGSSEYGDKK